MNQITDEALASLKAKFADQGQAFKLRYIDKDPAKGLLGVRITNAAKLLEDAWSIQILDRSTVSLAIGGFDNDHHVSLTGDDGEGFMEFLRAQIPAELWDLLPEGESKAAAPGPINDEKSKLIQWLADTYPAQFGSYGTATTAPDFYTAVMRLLAEIDRDYRDRRDYDAIVSLEALARQAYINAGRQLLAIECAPDENMRQEHRIEAHAILRAAEAYRNIAYTGRARLTLDGKTAPPPADFPEIPDITLDNLRDKIIDVSLEQKRPAGTEVLGDRVEPSKARNDLNNGLPLCTGPGDLTPGDIVVVANGNTPQFRQMATVIELAPEFASVRFSHAAAPVPLNYSDLVKPTQQP